ncbi:MAG: DUF3135 domain-containing protein [Desulfobulbaceae bacterium]|nr:DUF3135 domain-containing protein [Desulfobulbaceae bacterium]
MSDFSKKEENRQKYLYEHDRLSNLYITNRFAFELERKRIIREAIDDMTCSEEIKDRLRVQQKKLDKTLKGMGSAENRFAMIQALLWHHVVNTWQPALQNYSTTLNSFEKSMYHRPTVRLVKK